MRGQNMEGRNERASAGREAPWSGMLPSMLPSMNLSSASDAMRSNISWCRIISSEDEPLSTDRHKHTLHELHYVYEGELRFDFGGKTLTCGSNEYIFIPSGIMHTIEDTAPYTHKLVIGFEIISRNEIINKVFNQTHTPVAAMETRTFHELAQALMHKSSTSDLTTSVSIACIVHTLLLEIADSLAALTRNRAQRLRESEDGQRIDRMLSYINENVFNSITGDDVANAMGLSLRQTARICRRLFGSSLNQIIVQVRLKEICKLLTDSKYSIAEIAEIAGFASPYSFSRHFSHYTGVTPSFYRHNYEIRR